MPCSACGSSNRRSNTQNNKKYEPLAAYKSSKPPIVTTVRRAPNKPTAQHIQRQHLWAKLQLAAAKRKASSKIKKRSFKHMNFTMR